MPATMEERLDELLAMSRELGRLANEEARLGHAADSARPWERTKARRLAREARKARESKAETLAKSRASFLAALPAEGARS